MIAAIVQARMSSSRFPGKVLQPILGEPMIQRQLERIGYAQSIDRLVVATSDERSDDPLFAAVTQSGSNCFRGSLPDVLDRVYQAALSVGAEHVVRLTGDCPLTDPALIDDMVAMHVDGGNDYTSNTVSLSFPDGLDVEVIAMGALARTWAEAEAPEEREHVTPYLYRNAQSFKVDQLVNDANLSALRWTVDYPADLAFVRAVFADLYPEHPQFGFEEILALLEKNPSLSALNAEANPWGEGQVARRNPMAEGGAS